MCINNSEKRSAPSSGKFTLQMAAASSSETLSLIYPKTCCHRTEICHPDAHRHVMFQLGPDADVASRLHSKIKIQLNPTVTSKIQFLRCNLQFLLFRNKKDPFKLFLYSAAKDCWREGLFLGIRGAKLKADYLALVQMLTTDIAVLVPHFLHGC